MASAQCCKPAEQTCTQGHQNHSLGQKVSEMVSSVFKKEQTHQGQCQTQSMATKTQTMCVAQTNQGQGLANANGTKCHGKTGSNGEHKKKGLLQKIKDGISGHSDSSSSSDSESDDEKCCGKKN